MTSPHQDAPDYVHRLNPDGTVDSICRHCARTIAHEPDELKLDQAEANHVCSKKRRAGRKRAARN